MKLSDKFTSGRLLRFSFPSILMMVFTSIYTVVDGFFVSNFAGKSAFAAVNFVIPIILIFNAPGFMMGSGGSALVARTMGEQKLPKARRQFSLLVWSTLIMGIVFSVFVLQILDPLLRKMGCLETMLAEAELYGRISAVGIPMYMLQVFFQSFFVTAEKPTYGFYITLAGGLTNMILDYVFVGVLKGGVAGAALATNAGLMVGGLLPLLYFMRPHSSPLYLVRPKWDGLALLQTVYNGSSELLTNVSINLVGILYNWQLLRYIGEDGVSAYGVLLYVVMVFAAIFFGFTMGTAPILSYNFGAARKEELRQLLKRSLRIVLIFSVMMFIAAKWLSYPLSLLFVGYDEGLLDITVHAFSIFSWSFLFQGVAIYGSGFFTALNDGLTSALIAFFRTLVFQSGAVILFPILLGVDGIWMSLVFAELAAFFMVFYFLYRRRAAYTISPITFEK